MCITCKYKLVSFGNLCLIHQIVESLAVVSLWSHSLHIQDYNAVISSLPEYDPPSFFGLPANIDRSSQRTISSQVIFQLRVLMRSESTGDKFDRELWAAELNPLLALWKKLNQVSINFIHIHIIVLGTIPTYLLVLDHTSINKFLFYWLFR